MTNDDNRYDHEKIMLLLPWFVNQTLDEQRTAVVADHLQHCEACQREVQFLRSMKEAVRSDAQAGYREHADVNQDLAKVVARIDANSPRTNPVNQTTFLQQAIDKLSDYLRVFPFGFQGATALAGVLVAVMGFQYYYAPTGDDYTVLSSSEVADSAIRLSVQVASENDLDEVKNTIQSLFDTNGQKFDIENSNNESIVIVVDDTISAAELNTFVVDLSNQASVMHVELMP